jgi:hypothetical protein
MPLFVSPIVLFSLAKCYLINISNHKRNFLGQGGQMSPHPNTFLLTNFFLLLSSRGVNKRNCVRSGGKGVCILRTGSNKSPLFLTSLPPNIPGRLCSPLCCYPSYAFFWNNHYTKLSVKFKECTSIILSVFTKFSSLLTPRQHVVCTTKKSW